jgi:hypothetical protein
VLERAEGIGRFLDEPPPGVRLEHEYRLDQHLKLTTVKSHRAEKFEFSTTIPAIDMKKCWNLRR